MFDVFNVLFIGEFLFTSHLGIVFGTVLVKQVEFEELSEEVGGFGVYFVG